MRAFEAGDIAVAGDATFLHPERHADTRGPAAHEQVGAHDAGGKSQEDGDFRAHSRQFTGASPGQPGGAPHCGKTLDSQWLSFVYFS